MKYGDYISAEIKILRKQYNAALLAWLNDPENIGPLNEIEKIFNLLTGIERRESFRSLWWIASGLVEGLRIGGIPVSETSRKLLTSLNNELGHVQQSVSTGLKRGPSAALIQIMLDELSMTSRKGPSLNNIFKEFSLDAENAM